MKRVLGVAAAVLLLLVGALSAALGGLGLAVFGTTGSYSGPSSSIASTPEALALVADLAGVDVSVPLSELLGEATLSVASPQGTAVFVGSADQAAVDRYLFGVPYDLATKDGTWDTRAVPGVATTVAPPGDQTFWAASESGTDASIVLATGTQSETLVVMNADGSASITAELTLSFGGDRITWYAAIAIAVGLLLVVLGLTLLIRGGKKRKRQKSMATLRASAGNASLSDDNEAASVMAHGRSEPSPVASPDEPSV